MPVSKYLTPYNRSNEQSLLDDLVVESIKIHGVDCYYLPRTMDSIDPVLREVELTTYNSNFLIEMYPKDVQGFTGDGKFMSKFGLEIRDEMTFTVSRTTFGNIVTAGNTAIIRPNEGDLVYFPINNKAFQIKYVNHEAIFYQLGSLHTYDITCELFEYSNERFNTGISLIDVKYNALNNTLEDFALAISDGENLLCVDGSLLVLPGYKIEVNNPEAQNDEFIDTSKTFLDFSETDPFLDRFATL